MERWLYNTCHESDVDIVSLTWSMMLTDGSNVSVSNAVPLAVRVNVSDVLPYFIFQFLADSIPISHYKS